MCHEGRNFSHIAHAVYLAGSALYYIHKCEVQDWQFTPELQNRTRSRGNTERRLLLLQLAVANTICWQVDPGAVRAQQKQTPTNREHKEGNNLIVSIVYQIHLCFPAV